MKRIPLILGVSVSIYWLLAFSLAFRSISVESTNQPWWDFALIREPGYYIGSSIFGLFELIPGIEYGHILGDSLPIFITFLTVLLMFSLVVGFLVHYLTRKLVGC